MNDLIVPFETSTNWIENLALEELNMDESGVVNFNNHLNPVHFLEESSINFMNQLRDRFELFTNKFNECRGGHNGSQIKIFKISNTINDFMLFRNSLRLVVARKSNDLISIGFMSNSGNLFSARTNNDPNSISNISHEIRAHVGPFNEITWRYNGEIVNITSLVRYYLSEFLRNSAR